MEHALFNERHSIAIRVWHWLFFLFITVSITMVILASTMFVTRDNVAMVQEQVAREGGSVTADQARNVAHEYNDKLWLIHKITGIGMCLLLLFRMGIAVSAKKEERVITRLRRVLKLEFSDPAARRTRSHYLLAKYGYIVFYIMIVIMAITGVVLAFEGIEFFRSVQKPMKSIHSIVQWGIYGYILLHLGGVVLADLTHSSGLVSRMIHGKRS